MGFTRSDIMQETGVMVHYSGEDTKPFLLMETRIY